LNVLIDKFDGSIDESKLNNIILKYLNDIERYNNIPE
jgi:hypothetical protein